MTLKLRPAKKGTVPPTVQLVSWTIQRNSDDVIRTLPLSESGKPDFLHFYFFDGGNMDCDCNRERAFMGAGIEDTECTEDRFSVLYLTDAQGNHWVND